MTKKIIVLMALALALSPAFVGAQEASVTTGASASITATTSKPGLKDKMENKMDKMASTSAAKLSERQEKVRAHADDLFAHLNRIIDQIANLITRVDTRIAKMDAEGKDTAKAKTASMDAKNFVLQAKASLDPLKLQVETAANSGTPVKSFVAVRTAIKSTTDTVRKAHEKVVEAIKALAKVSGTMNATTTVSASTSSQ